MVVVRDLKDLVCPACGTRNKTGVTGMSLINPVGCTEEVIVIRCAGCAATYLEIQEDSMSHPDGPDFWTRGPFADERAEEIIRRIEECATPFDKFCHCPSHGFMGEVMYGRPRSSSVSE